MIWDARNISNFAFHRRRFVLACLVVVLDLVSVYRRANYLRKPGATFIEGIVPFLIYMIAAVYFSRMAILEFRKMRQHG